VATSYSVAASVTPVIHTAPAVIDPTYAAQYSQTTEASLYQQPGYYKDQYPPDSASSASQQPFDSGLSRQGWYHHCLEHLPPKCKVTILKYITGNTTGQSSLAPQGDNFIGEGVPAANVETPLDPRKSLDTKTNEVLILLGFKIHLGREFKFGKVFRILWAEPMGSHGTQITEAVHSRSQKYGEGFHHKIRRFLIVKTFKAHCICL
jgi:hypothetical protein